MKFIVVLLCVAVVGCLAAPLSPEPESQTQQVVPVVPVAPAVAAASPEVSADKIVIVSKDPERQEELVRKARQIFEDINIDIISGGGGYGGYGGYGGGYGGYGGYGGGYGGYGGYPGGYGGYGGGYGAPYGYGGYNNLGGFFG